MVFQWWIAPKVTRAYFWNFGNFWCNCGKKLWNFFSSNCGKNMWKFILKSRFSRISYHKINNFSLFLHMGMSFLWPVFMIFWKIWEFLIIFKIFCTTHKQAEENISDYSLWNNFEFWPICGKVLIPIDKKLFPKLKNF